MAIACDQPPSWLIRNQQSGRLRIDSALGVFLIAETVFHIPSVLIITLAIALAIPALKTIRRNLSRPCQLVSEIKGLMFSEILPGHGLPAKLH
jgi:hypothetical protein